MPEPYAYARNFMLYSFNLSVDILNKFRYVGSEVAHSDQSRYKEKKKKRRMPY